MKIGTTVCLELFLKEATLSESIIPYESSAPVFVLTGENDNLVIADVVKESIPNLCDMGYQIEYHQCADLGHVDAALDTLPMQFQFVQDRIAGIPQEETCGFIDTETCDTYE